MYFKASKVVAALPNPLDVNTLYFVRTGAGFDLYVSDVTGNIAHAINRLVASDIFNDVLTLDGAGSTLDADLLDGFDSTDFSLCTYNVETITNQKNLTFFDNKYQYLSSSVNQIINLPNPVGIGGKEFFIVNTGNFILEVRENNLVLNLFLKPSGIIECHSDNNNWNIFIKY